MMASMMMHVFWDVTLCSLVETYILEVLTDTVIKAFL
jgi:hypothetical protein